MRWGIARVPCIIMETVGETRQVIPEAYGSRMAEASTFSPSHVWYDSACLWETEQSCSGGWNDSVDHEKLSSEMSYFY